MKKIIIFGFDFLLTLAAVAQNRTISGRVTDSTGLPVSGVSVTVKGSRQGVSSQADGSYTISVPAGAEALVISSIGYDTKEVPIEDRCTIDIVLNQAAGQLNEVVVVAYGQQNRRKITGAVGKLPGSELENVPMSSVDHMLQGKVAGLQSVAPSGQAQARAGRSRLPAAGPECVGATAWKREGWMLRSCVHSDDRCIVRLRFHQ